MSAVVIVHTSKGRAFVGPIRDELASTLAVGLGNAARAIGLDATVAWEQLVLPRRADQVIRELASLERAEPWSASRR